VANDVNILVTAELGDTLIKLDLAKHAINDLGDEAKQAAVKQEEAAASSSLFTDAMAGMNGILSQSIPLLGGFSVPLVALPVVAGAAAIAVVALADAIGTLVAVVADFVAPATIVVGLLGGLAAGFVIAAKRAAEGGGPFKHFHKQLSDLHDQFTKVSTDLALRFLPYLERLAGAASKALTFIDKLAHEPLAKAMHDMATQGVDMLRRFVNQVTAVVAQPIRLAFQIAFGAGPGGNQFASLVANWWHRFTAFLFGYTVQHPIRLDGRVIQIDQQHVNGILQPLVDWFNRHHFTKQGIQIGHEILGGLMNSAAAHRMGQFLVTVFEDAGKTVGRQFIRLAFTNTLPIFRRIAQMMEDIIKRALGAAWEWVSTKAVRVWHSILTLATNAMGAAKANIEHAIGAAWSWVKTQAQQVWHKIVSIFTAPLHISIDWPSIPNPLSLLGGGGSSSPSRGGGGAASPTGNVIVVHNHFHSVDLTTHAARERVASQVGDSMLRQWQRQAGR
jgi:hypothetical protein